MRVINRTKHKTLHGHIKIARTFDEKVRGLLDAKQDDACMCETRWGIHTFGMKFPIDCVVCDEQNNVRALRSHLPKGRVFFWNPLYKKIYEFPAGTIFSTGTEIGDEIVIE